MASFFVFFQKAEAIGEKRPRGRPRKWVSSEIQFSLLKGKECFFKKKLK